MTNRIDNEATSVVSRLADVKDATAINLLAVTCPNEWMKFMSFVSKRREHVRDRLEVEKDDHECLRLQGDARIFREILGLSKDAQTILEAETK